MAAAAFVVASTPSVAFASEGDGWYSYGNYSLDRSISWLTGPTPVTVIPGDGAALCGITYGSQTVTAAPWTVTLDPAGPRSIKIDACDPEMADEIQIFSATPFASLTAVINAGSGKQKISLVNDTDATAIVNITDPAGKTLASGTIPAQTTGEISVNTKNITKTTKLTATVSDPASGLEMRFPVVVAYKWAPMYTEADSYGPTVAPCSTVKWFYDASGQPSAAKGFAGDIQPALNVLGKETGLTFARVNSKDEADLTFTWSGQWGKRTGPSAVGGYSYAWGSDTGRTFDDLGVTLNKYDHWVTDKFPGLEYRNRMAGRGWLIVHEVMHTLGFTHYNAKSEVMNPINFGQHAFGTGDLQGLHEFYPTAGCKA